MAASESSRKTVPPGTRLGRYEVITEIASGGMATVYLGRALGAAGFTRLVAIKVMHPHIGRDDDFVAMFMDEARLAARIRHPNVVPTLDLENGDEGLFLVMEFVEGDGLLGLLRATSRAGKRAPAPVALRVILDVLAGLHAAHELKGDAGEPLRLVHRDISPHNILVGADGITRITDFGIARAEERLSVTRDGQIKGKLAYMAPEQTSGQPVDRRADVFATAVVLWECLAGKRLFHGANDGEVLRNLLVNPIPALRSAAPDLPEALEQVCTKALARHPDERYSTASDFADALEEAGGAVGIASARAVGRWVRELAGAKIEAFEMAVRELSGDAKTSDVRPVPGPRPRQLTDPERTVAKAEPPIIPLPANPDSLPKHPPVVLAPERKRSPALLGVGLLLLLGAGSALVAWKLTVGANAPREPAGVVRVLTPPAPPAPTPAPAPAPAPAPPPEPAAPPPAPVAQEVAPEGPAAPAEGSTDRSRPGRPGRPLRGGRVGTEAPPPAVGAPPAPPPSRPPPPPSPGGFNPEAM